MEDNQDLLAPPVDGEAERQRAGRGRAREDRRRRRMIDRIRTSSNGPARNARTGPGSERQPEQAAEEQGTPRPAKPAGGDERGHAEADDDGARIVEAELTRPAHEPRNRRGHPGREQAGGPAVELGADQNTPISDRPDRRGCRPSARRRTDRPGTRAERWTSRRTGATAARRG